VAVAFGSPIGGVLFSLEVSSMSPNFVGLKLTVDRKWQAISL
jgi:H+/Cl- antiporter ClcA